VVSILGGLGFKGFNRFKGFRFWVRVLVRVPDAGCRMQDAGCGMQDAGCRMQDAGCGIRDAGSAIRGSGIRD
jgi:hypothetical protein